MSQYQHAPKIAITKPDAKDRAAYLCLAAAIRLAGGRPFAVTAETMDKAASYDGVVVGGGQDILPMLYDDQPQQGRVYDEPRDRMDVDIVTRAVDHGTPVLGICRGAQLMNVVRGGSLHLSTRAAYEDADYPDSLLAKIFFRKQIITEAGSLIRQAVGRRLARVNSLHEQSVRKLGTGLVATARETNGVIQAIEDPKHPFFLGVQFHPEFLIHRSRFRRIFELFVSRAKAAPRPETA